MQRMLFNAVHAEELRVAIVDGQKLLNLDLESAIRSEKKGNIYKGVITKVEPSLEACFVNYGAERQGFLPMKDIYREYFQGYNSKTPISDVKIDDVISEGQEMIVQVDKDERGSKGAALTTFISLAGRFLVFMPNNPKGGGISRRIAGEERAELKNALAGLDIDPRHSLIARTEGIGRSVEALQWDLDFLTRVWEGIEKASADLKAPFLIYQESNLIVRSIRDYLTDDIAELIVDDEEIYDRASRFIDQVIPGARKKLKLYQNTTPLFSRFQIEDQIDSVFNREVDLPSGGSLTIDHTEALISIDVNSARATKGGDIEETALQTNLEAVEEIARQLRIRDIGGLIVIDLIDMTVNKNQRTVESRLKKSLQTDRARVQVGHISRFGLLEMSRQRLRSSISEMNYRICPRCDGAGTIRSVISSSVNLLRIIEDEALKEYTEAVQVALPLDMATYLLNEKRHELYQLEARLSSRIIILPTDELTSPHFEIKRLRSQELDELGGVMSFKQKPGLEHREPSATDSLKSSRPERAVMQLDQVQYESPPKDTTGTATDHRASVPVPVKQAKPQKSWFGRIAFGLFGGHAKSSDTADEEETGPHSQHGRHNKPAQKRNRPNTGNRGKNPQRGQTDKPSKSKAHGNQGRRQGNRNNDTSPKRERGHARPNQNDHGGRNRRNNRRDGNSHGQNMTNTDRYQVDENGWTTSTKKPSPTHQSSGISQAGNTRQKNTPGQESNRHSAFATERKPGGSPQNQGRGVSGRQPAPTHGNHKNAFPSSPSQSPAPENLPDDIGNRK